MSQGHNDNHLLKWFWLSELRVRETQPGVFHGENKTKKSTQSAKLRRCSSHETNEKTEKRGSVGNVGCSAGAVIPEPGCHAAQGEQLHVLTWLQLPAFGSRAAEVSANKGSVLNVFDVFSVFYESMLCNSLEGLLYGIFVVVVKFLWSRKSLGFL